MQSISAMKIFFIILIFNKCIISALEMKVSYENITRKLENGATRLGFLGSINGKFEVKQRGLKIQRMIRKDPQNYPQPENYGDPSKLHILDKLIWFFPKGLEKYFAGVVILKMINCQLKEIKQEDLKGFPELEHLNLDLNQIEVLEKDLFKYNPKLDGIRFFSNLIRYIDANIFDNLSKLELVIFGGNQCINFAATNRTEVEVVVKRKVNNNCQKFGLFVEKEKVKISGTKRGKYFWILVGCGVIVGIFVVFAIARIVYGIIKSV